MLRLLTAWMFLAAMALGQAGFGTITGQVTDPSGASVPAALVALHNQSVHKQSPSNATGRYSITVPAGTFTVTCNSKGFSRFELLEIRVMEGQSTTLDIPLTIAMEMQRVSVEAGSGGLSVEASGNAGAVVLNQHDLNNLSDNPDDFASDLQALAGPGMGPDGGQLLVDGFTGRRLPPKDSIREVRINANPFSAEFEKMGLGRIEIFTKPGADRLHAQASLTYGDRVLNARNPLLAGPAPDYQQELATLNIGGKLNARSNFTLDVDQRYIDENALVVATVLGPNLDIRTLQEGVVTPARRTSLWPRIDYQLTPRNTLTGRLSLSWISNDNQNVGQNNLPSAAVDYRFHDAGFQVWDTAVIGTRTMNEARFSFYEQWTDRRAAKVSTQTVVQDAFTDGGPMLANSSQGSQYDFQDVISYVRNRHQVRAGGKLHALTQGSSSTTNFNGQFVFSGTRAMTSIDDYRQTQLLLQRGLTPNEIRAQGFGPSLFLLTGGEPHADITQWDSGVFVQDDWRLRPNLTLSSGMRVERQNDLSGLDWAPRAGLAWAPGAAGKKAAKTVIRLGAGMFYRRLPEDYALNTIRQNGVLQQQYIVYNPDFYPRVPSLDELRSYRARQAVRTLAADLRSPRALQTAIGTERELPRNIKLSANYTYTHGTREFRARDINAPLAATGLRPYGAAAGDIYQYEGSGRFQQNQLVTILNARLSPRLSLFGWYTLSSAHTDRESIDSAPSDPYDLRGEWSRAAFDARHRGLVSAMYTGPAKFILSPYFVAASGTPFNIVTGTDRNGDGIYTDRPAFAADQTRPGVIRTPWGAFDPTPVAGEQIIPRNYAQGPGFVSINVRLSRTWHFGEVLPGGARRYRFAAAVAARNALNHVNPGTPVGNLTSPLFGQSTYINNGMVAGANQGGAGNRRIEFTLRFGF